MRLEQCVRTTMSSTNSLSSMKILMNSARTTRRCCVSYGDGPKISKALKKSGPNWGSSARCWTVGRMNGWRSTGTQSKSCRLAISSRKSCFRVSLLAATSKAYRHSPSLFMCVLAPRAWEGVSNRQFCQAHQAFRHRYVLRYFQCSYGAIQLLLRLPELPTRGFQAHGIVVVVSQVILTLDRDAVEQLQASE